MKLKESTWFYFYQWRRRNQVKLTAQQVQAKGFKNAQRKLKTKTKCPVPNLPRTVDHAR